MDGSFGSRTGSSYGWDVLFAGYRYDAESGLYHVRNRAYHPGLGRWLSRDPFDYLAGSNLLAYSDDPINELDSTGLCKCNRGQGTADHCCKTWTSGWQLQNYGSKLACFRANVRALAPNLALVATGSAYTYLLTLIGRLKGGGVLVPTTIFIGGAVIYTTVIFKAYDVCNDHWCTATRAADEVSGFWGPKCGCLDGNGNLGPVEQIGDRRSP
jgi:RHS repeat-associated protein